MVRPDSMATERWLKKFWFNMMCFDLDFHLVESYGYIISVKLAIEH